MPKHTPKCRLLKRLCVVFLSMAMPFSALLAQDPYFAQYTQMPAVYNPAMTGMNDAIFKVGLLYQDHLNFSNSGIRKGVLLGEFGKDIQLAKDGVTTDRLGLGLGLIYDDFNGGAFFNNSFLASVAYLKSLSPRNNHKIGLGLQAHYSNRTIDYSRLTFATQFLQGFYDKTINSHEIIGSRSASYFDFQVGLLYSYTSNFFNLKTGIAAYHVTEPESDEINDFKIKMTLTYFASFEMWFPNYKRLYLDGYYRYKNLELSYFGVLSRYTLINFTDFNTNIESTFLLVGLNVNSNLLVSPYIGLKSPSIDAGLSFDLKVSNIDYYAYPFESFFEFMIAYKIKANKASAQHVGAGFF